MQEHRRIHSKGKAGHLCAEGVGAGDGERLHGRQEQGRPRAVVRDAGVQRPRQRSGRQCNDLPPERMAVQLSRSVPVVPIELCTTERGFVLHSSEPGHDMLEGMQRGEEMGSEGSGRRAHPVVKLAPPGAGGTRAGMEGHCSSAHAHEARPIHPAIVACGLPVAPCEQDRFIKVCGHCT